MAICSKCGQKLPRIVSPIAFTDANQVLEMLQHDSDLQMYKSTVGTWHLTRHRGQIAPEVVASLVNSGSVQSVYSNIPSEAYHVGKTWDYEATMAARKRGDKINIYTDGTRGR